MQNENNIATCRYMQGFYNMQDFYTKILTNQNLKSLCQGNDLVYARCPYLWHQITCRSICSILDGNYAFMFFASDALYLYENGFLN